MNEEAKSSSYLNKSLRKALEVLELFNDHEKMRANEIVEVMDTSTGSIYPTLHTLERFGYLRRDENKEYRLGLKFLHKSELVLDRIELREQAKKDLRQLRDLTDGTVHLGVRAEEEIIYIDKFDPTGPIRMYSDVGKKAPAHATALGKAILAFLPPKELTNVLGEGPLKKFTSRTTTDIEELKQELAKIRERGYSIDNAEHEEEIRCVGAPIFNYKDEVLAAISLTVPSAQYSLEELENFIEPVKRAAERITEKMGSDKYREKSSLSS